MRSLGWALVGALSAVACRADRPADGQPRGVYRLRSVAGHPVPYQERDEFGYTVVLVRGWCLVFAPTGNSFEQFDPTEPSPAGWPGYRRQGFTGYAVFDSAG